MKKALLVLLIIFFMCGIAEARQITLTWTAPADDAGTPTQKPVTAYRLVYSEAPITETNFGAATILTTEIPKAIGQAEVYTYDLPEGKHYFFAVKSMDDSANWSALSNVVEVDFLAPSPITDLSSQY